VRVHLDMCRYVCFCFDTDLPRLSPGRRCGCTNGAHTLVECPKPHGLNNFCVLVSKVLA